jgi:hypothetical protein
MAKPTSNTALKTRLQTLDTELIELQVGARDLGGTNPAAAEGLSRAVKEMRKTLNRVKDQGFISKL